MNVSIGLCTRNRCASLIATLASIAASRVPNDYDCELIVVDNGSSDDTPNVVAQAAVPNMKLRYLHEPRIGKGYAYNTFLAAALGAILLFTDDDVRVPTDWVEPMCAPIARGAADAVEGGVTLPPHLERAWMTPSLRRWLACTDSTARVDGPQMVGANMAFAAAVRTAVPAFDAELGPGGLGFYEETLYSFQLAAAGYRLISALDVAVEHHLDPRRLLRTSFLEMARGKGRSLAYFAHHWEHRVVPAPRWALMKLEAHLGEWRVTRSAEWHMVEGIAQSELNLVTQLNFYKQYLIERKRPRNYAKRGLQKIGDVAPAPATTRVA